MGLDIYAGTLTRYYSGNWKSLAQRYAEDSGIPFRTVGPGGGTGREPRPAAEICGSVIAWRDAVLAGLRETAAAPFPCWEENGEKAYRTDKPDWDAYGALVLFSACLQCALPLDATVGRGWNWRAHSVLVKAQAEKSCGGALVSGVELWLPFRENLFFHYSDCHDHETVFGTVGGLIAELEGLNAASWRAQEETIRRWRVTEGYGTAEYDLADGRLVPCAVRQESYSTASLAKFAFSILWDLSHFALATGVPLKLDY